MYDRSSQGGSLEPRSRSRAWGTNGLAGGWVAARVQCRVMQGNVGSCIAQVVGSAPCIAFACPCRPPADIVFVIKEQKHPRFTRQGNDLYTTVQVGQEGIAYRQLSSLTRAIRLTVGFKHADQVFGSGFWGKRLPVSRRQ
jgi:hypothetical protein